MTKFQVPNKFQSPITHCQTHPFGHWNLIVGYYLVIGFWLLVIPHQVFASNNSSPLHLDQQVRHISDQLRCPVCRGIPISESPSALARDMMTLIREKLQKGESEEQILKYFEDHYGEWILLKPKPHGFNLIVWVLPFILLIGGGGFLALKISQWTRRT